ncbi:response regulator [Hymenobacter sp. GOD-10R]|uniref:response regulator n=1 Tax=Hymenobacter sp. GOD-10R TaxID=3093922 RepID=UPI002D77BDED|nr:response regulator [Hymenobacter sp. GOD-10R]WRQ27647.1 response regulator [Hymenobacter sp. GOD-10R]
MGKLPCILLVDDDPVNNFINQRLLEGLAITEQLIVALNGQEAFNLMEQHCQPAPDEACPALILLDINMPIMNGFEFLQAYQQLPLAQQKAIVIAMLTTTSLHPADVVRAQQLCVSDFLSKPLTKDKINALLQKYFDNVLTEN